MPTSRPAGYSGTPLAKKLGFAPGSRGVVHAAPDDWDELIAPLPEGVRFDRAPSQQTDIAIVFTPVAATLRTQLERHRVALRPDAMVWACWPKKASKRPTDITEDVVRELALPLGFVDVKVCAVSDVWSGLKLVVRKHLR